jgi:hypothetical protein
MKILDFLLDRFEYNEEKDCYYSKKKWIGLSNGDDRTLYLEVDNRGSLIWWRENRGSEYTIFDGKSLKTEEEFENVFDLLNIKLYLKW